MAAAITFKDKVKQFGEMFMTNKYFIIVYINRMNHHDCNLFVLSNERGTLIRWYET